MTYLWPWLWRIAMEPARVAERPGLAVAKLQFERMKGRGLVEAVREIPDLHKHQGLEFSLRHQTIPNTR